MKNITDQMLKGFNEWLDNRGSLLRLERAEGRNGVVDIVLMHDPLIKNDSLVYPTKEFYERLESYFGNHNITLNYNNTGTTFWDV